MSSISLPFLDFQPTSWLLFLWVSLLIETRFESQRWLRAVETGRIQSACREEILDRSLARHLRRPDGNVGALCLVRLEGWLAVGLVVLCNAATFLLAGIPDSFLVWIVSAAAVIPLCEASLLTVYFQ